MSCALIEVSMQDYEMLTKAISIDGNSHEKNTPFLCGTQEKKALTIPPYKVSKRVEIKSGTETEWGILEGGKLIYFLYSNT